MVCLMFILVKHFIMNYLTNARLLPKCLYSACCKLGFLYCSLHQSLSNWMVLREISLLVRQLRKSGRTAWKREHTFHASSSAELSLLCSMSFLCTSRYTFFNKKILLQFCGTCTISPKWFYKPEMAFKKLFYSDIFWTKEGIENLLVLVK